MFKALRWREAGVFGVVLGVLATVPLQAQGADGVVPANPAGSAGSGSIARPSLPAPTVDHSLGWTEAPGGYGTSWGTPSYGSVRTYSEFASPYGQGYSYGYAPETILPGPYGAGIWAPGSPAATTWDTSTASRFSYRTFRVPYVKGSTKPVPPFGVYAPAFGPGLPGR